MSKGVLMQNALDYHTLFRSFLLCGYVKGYYSFVATRIVCNRQKKAGQTPLTIYCIFLISISRRVGIHRFVRLAVCLSVCLFVRLLVRTKIQIFETKRARNIQTSGTLHSSSECIRALIHLSYIKLYKNILNKKIFGQPSNEGFEQKTTCPPL